MKKANQCEVFVVSAAYNLKAGQVVKIERDSWGDFQALPATPGEKAWKVLGFRRVFDHRTGWHLGAEVVSVLAG